MEHSFRLFQKPVFKLLFLGAMLVALSFALVATVRADTDDAVRDGRLVTFHDRGEKRVIHTYARTINDALKDANITLAPKDVIEPSVDTKLIATDYAINIYRARPVVVVDGMVRQKVLTASQSAKGIVEDSGVTALNSEDKANFATSKNIIADGASITLTIDRATSFTLQMYGKPITAYTHASTVADMLKSKDITLAPNDSLSVSADTPITDGMIVAIWRDGVQTTTVDEPVQFKSRQILDMDQPVGYRAVKTAGVAGAKSVSYEITANNGKEITRKVIQSVITKEPTDEIVVVGNAPRNPLSKSKGAQHWSDSNGVSHRETYYDLPMNVVMNACGGGGYTVRADGAKVDRDGYILVAAHLGNYPRCSIVQTSMGLGKVYDTGGFTAKHPHGFDLATDWSKPDGV